MSSKRDPLDRKRVLVIGFERQGQALARWLPTVGAWVTVNDKRTAEQMGLRISDWEGVRFILGEHPEEALDGVHLVCLSGGVPLDLPLVQAAIAAGIPLSNDAQLFAERCPAPILGITGSAGKTTTTTLTGEIMKRAGYTTWVGGNVGHVLIESLRDIQTDHAVVLELSSFQLEIMEFAPAVGAVLNITPNHLDRHKTMEAYIAAKASMVRHQRPPQISVLCEDDPNSKALEAVAGGDLASFSMRTLVADGAFLAGDRLVLAGSASVDGQPRVLCQRHEIPLRGDHNVLNVLAACAISGSFGLATDRPGVEPEAMREAILAFRPVPHRLEVVRVLDGVTYVNDSIATAPERLIAALRSYTEPLVLLIGGADKDLPWEKAASLALQKSRHIILFGKAGEKQVGDKAHKLLKLLGATERELTRVETLEQAVQRAHEVAQAGDVVLLSPGGTSYDAYKDFEARGEHFRQLVLAL